MATESIPKTHKPSESKTAADRAARGKSLPAVPVLQQKPKEQEELQQQKPIADERLTSFTSAPPQVTEPPSGDSLPANTTVQKKDIKSAVKQEPLSRYSPIQKKANNTGLPDNLKTGVENLSGYDMSDVKVHYNSAKPAQLQAHAYAQGAEIHIGPGQERHLPHEAWHVAQQKQGRVQATMQMKGDVPVNDDKGLEQEADIMGAKALDAGNATIQQKKITDQSIQQPVAQYIKAVTAGGAAIVQRFADMADNPYLPTRDVDHPALRKIAMPGPMGPYKFYPMLGVFKYQEPTIAALGVEKFILRTLHHQTVAALYEPEKIAAVPGKLVWKSPQTNTDIDFHPAGLQPALPAARVATALNAYQTEKSGNVVPGKVRDGLKAHNNAAGPRPFVSVATEDGYGAAAHAHTLDRHVIGGGAGIPDGDAVAARALFGKLGGLAGAVAGVYTPIATAFQTLGGANADVAAVMNGDFTANWKKYREELVTNGIVNIQTARAGAPVVAYSSASGGKVDAKYVPEHLGGPATGRLPLFHPDPRWDAWALGKKISNAGKAQLIQHKLGIDESGNVNRINVRIIASDNPAHNGWFIHSAFPIT